MKWVEIAIVAALVATAAAPVRASDCLTLEDFAKARLGEFPAGWKPRKDAGRELYTVLEEKGLRFLRGVARGFGIQAAKPHEWDLGVYPVLAWAWRVQEFPRGADEREPATNDSAAAVYLVVPYSRMTGPKAVKYVWSEKVPVGTRLTSNMGLTQVRVLRSGPAKRGEWVEERANVRDDYRRYFETDDTPRPAGIAVLTDSDDTKSSAQGDYANFRACRS
ncbi:MAG: DUF3047 domain-containing protein [Candidatus Rokubacteria bacterium]|nr:DUF3047 domain-containing protein [Candidatus Rokubacteria bacterium]